MELKNVISNLQQLPPEEKLLRRWQRIPQDVAQSMALKLKAVEEMADFAREMQGDDAPQKRHSIDSERRTDNPDAPAFKVSDARQ